MKTAFESVRQPLDTTIPDPALIALIGAVGSGKSTWVRTLPATQVLEPDRFRAMVADDFSVEFSVCRTARPHHRPPPCWAVHPVMRRSVALLRPHPRGQCRGHGVHGRPRRRSLHAGRPTPGRPGSPTTTSARNVMACWRPRCRWSSATAPPSLSRTSGTSAHGDPSASWTDTCSTQLAPGPSGDHRRAASRPGSPRLCPSGVGGSSRSSSPGGRESGGPEPRGARAAGAVRARRAWRGDLVQVAVHTFRSRSTA